VYPEVVEVFGRDWQNPIPLGWRIGNIVSAQGITGVNPETGALAPSLEGQAEQALATLREIVERAGGSVDNVARVTAFVASPEDRNAFYGPWEECYAEPRPACKVLPTQLPPGHRVHLDLLAVLGCTRERIDVPGVSAHDPTVKLGSLLFTSRVHGSDPANGEMPPTFEAQANLAFQNIKSLVEIAGGSAANITQVQVFLRDNPLHSTSARRHFEALVEGVSPRPQLRLQEAFMRPQVQLMIEAIAANLPVGA
jgi:enamine deaminase RidA (YjgF/YER057c/UK114 family)